RRSAATAGRPTKPAPRTPAPATSSSTGRSVSTSTRPTTCCSSSRSSTTRSGCSRRPMPADAGAPLPDGRLEVIALDGIPEVVPGDDLVAFLGDAIERSAGALPLHDDDVLVVTQKVVSKAEGAIVDLTTVEPRPEAVEFATAYDRDPRQIEVVLREAVRV